MQKKREWEPWRRETLQVAHSSLNKFPLILFFCNSFFFNIYIAFHFTYHDTIDDDDGDHDDGCVSRK